MPLFDRLQIDRAQRARFAVTQISDEMTADKPACPADNNVTMAIVQEFGMLETFIRFVKIIMFCTMSKAVSRIECRSGLCNSLYIIRWKPPHNSPGIVGRLCQTPTFM